MEIRHPIHPDHGKALDTEGLRREFLITDLFSPARSSSSTATSTGSSSAVRSPTSAALPLEVEKAVIGTDHLLDSRELGILNLGGDGSVIVDGKEYPLDRLDALYVGQRDEIRGVLVARAPRPPRGSTCSRPSPTGSFPTTLVGRDKAQRVVAGPPRNATGGPSTRSSIPTSSRAATW